MNDTVHIDPENLALHAMQFLTGDEALAAAAHLEHCSECRREFMALQNDLAGVALSVPLETPTAQARERFLAQILREKRVVPIDRAVRASETTSQPVPVKKSASGGLLPWLGWAVAAGATFSATSFYQERNQLKATVAGQSVQMATLSADAAREHALMDALTDRSAMRVTLNTTPAAKPAPQGRATYVADKGTLVFIANNLEPLPLDTVYELWLIPANGTGPIPAGTFHPDARGNASVIMPELPKGVQAKAFGVTIEAEGGATTPTLPILMVGG